MAPIKVGMFSGTKGLKLLNYLHFYLKYNGTFSGKENMS